VKSCKIELSPTNYGELYTLYVEISGNQWRHYFSKSLEGLSFQ